MPELFQKSRKMTSKTTTIQEGTPQTTVKMLPCIRWRPQKAKMYVEKLTWTNRVQKKARS